MTVDFKSLRQAHGVATKIPANIKRLAGSNEETRRAAFDELRTAFFKRGEWFSASAPTVSLLLEAVPGAAAPADVLFVLAEIIGSDHCRAWLSPLDDRLPTDIVAAANERAGILFQALKSESAEARAGALLVLAMLPTLRDRALPAIHELALGDSNELVQASALLALGRLGLSDPKSQDLLAERESAATGVARGAAAIARLRARPERAFADARAGIRAWLDTKLPVATAQEPRFPWFGAIDYHPERDVPLLSGTAAPLELLAQERNQQRALLDLLLEEGASNSSGRFGREATALIGALAALPVPKNRHQVVVSLPNELAPAHLELAQRLSDTELVPLPGRGLPASGSLRKRWLGLLPPGPLEQLIETSLGDTKRTVPFWFALRALSADTPLDRFIHPSLEPLVSGIDRWHLVAEYASGAYGEWFVSQATGSAEIERELAFLPKTDAGFARLRSVTDEAAARVRAAKAMDMPLGKIAPYNANMSLLLLPWIRSGRALPVEWEDLIYIGPESETREVLATLSPERREACVWRYFACANTYNHAAYNYIGDVLDLVPSRRITEALLRANAVMFGVFDSKALEARVKAVAQSEPEVAEAVRAFEAEQLAPPTKSKSTKKTPATKANVKG